VNILEQWVDTERQIATVSSEWEQERSSMRDLIDIYTAESAQLDGVIEEAAEAVGVAEERRARLLARDEELKELESQVMQQIMAAERAVKGLEAQLPEPLREELRPLFRVIPENPEESRLPIGQRIQPVVAILTQIQRFNQVVTITEGFRDFEAGRTVQTEKVFFGLGAAYYVDGANEHAGVGVLGEDGWRWDDDAALVPQVRQFVEIYRGSSQATYVPMPLKVR
jgi:hypothetical protein